MMRGLYRGERMDVARKFHSEMANITPINNKNFLLLKEMKIDLEKLGTTIFYSTLIINKRQIVTIIMHV